MEYIIESDLNVDVEKVYASIMQLDINTPDDGDVSYKRLYLFLFNKITDIAEDLKNALESNDPRLQTRTVLQTVAELWAAQSEAETILLSQNADKKASVMQIKEA